LQQLAEFLSGLNVVLDSKDPNAVTARSLAIGLTLAQGSLSQTISMIQHLWNQPADTLIFLAR